MNAMLHQSPMVLRVREHLAMPAACLHEQFLALYHCEFIVIDLSGVDILQPALMAELSQLRLRRKHNGLLLGRLVIDSPNLRNALSAIGFERQWPIFRTCREALASFGKARFFA